MNIRNGPLSIFDILAPWRLRGSVTPPATGPVQTTLASGTVAVLNAGAHVILGPYAKSDLAQLVDVRVWPNVIGGALIADIGWPFDGRQLVALAFISTLDAQDGLTFRVFIDNQSSNNLSVLWAAIGTKAQP